MSGQTWSRESIHRWLKGLIPLALVVVLLVFWGRVIITVAAPFVVGFLIAYIFNPVVAWIEGRNRRKHRMNRLMAVLALYVALFLAGVLLILILAMAVQEVVLFGQRLPQYGANLYRLIEESILTQWEKVPEEFVEWVKSQLEAENLQRILQEEILPRLQDENIKSGVGTAVKGVTGFVQVAFGLAIWAARQLMEGREISSPLFLRPSWRLSSHFTYFWIMSGF
jgi:predicted PurR-regulated permease PerM